MSRKQRKKKQKLKFIDYFQTKLGTFVVCTDINDQEWILPILVFDRFRYEGLPYSPVSEKIRTLTLDKKWTESETEVEHLIITLLETTLNKPIQDIFPMLETYKGDR